MLLEESPCQAIHCICLWDFCLHPTTISDSTHLTVDSFERDYFFGTDIPIQIVDSSFCGLSIYFHLLGTDSGKICWILNGLFICFEQTEKSP